MPSYLVTVTLVARGTRKYETEIEADTEEDAISQADDEALSATREYGSDVEWEITAQT